MYSTRSNSAYNIAEPEQSPYSNPVLDDEMQQQYGITGDPAYLEHAYPPYYTDGYGPDTNAAYSQNPSAQSSAPETLGSFPEAADQSAYSPAQAEFQSYVHDGMFSQLGPVQSGGESRDYNQSEGAHQQTTPHEHHTRHGVQSAGSTGGDWQLLDNAAQTDSRRSLQFAHSDRARRDSYSGEADPADSGQREAVYNTFENLLCHPEGGDRQYFPQDPIEQYEEQSEYSMDIDPSLPALVAMNSDMEHIFQQTREPPWSTVYNRQDWQHLPEPDLHALDGRDTFGASDTSDGDGFSLSNAITPGLSTCPSSVFQDMPNSMGDSQVTVVPSNTWPKLESIETYQNPPASQHGYHRTPIPDVVVQKDTPELEVQNVSDLGGASSAP
jgi:hypothetical protein